MVSWTRAADQAGLKRERTASKEGARVPIVAINANGSVAKANAPARKVLGSPPQDLEGANLGAVLVELLARRRGLGRRTSLSFDNAAGEREDVLVVLSDAVPAGKPSVDTRRAPVEAPEGRSADFIAHELRNPMGTILGLADILDTRLDTLPASDRRIAVETIRGEAERALLILESVLRLAEARTKPQVDLTSVPLHSVVGKVLRAHQRRNSHRTVAMRGDAPLYARANSMWLELALSNLINNAEKYTPHDRTIEIAFHQNGSKATILVLDNGNGLPPESYRSLWDLYYRGRSPEVLVGGSGIGLALCKELIEGMGGQVWAGPRKTGGSVFALSLATAADSTIPAPLGTRISATPLNFLLSDPAIADLW